RRPADWLLPPQPEEDARPPAPEPDAAPFTKREFINATPTSSPPCRPHPIRRTPDWAGSPTPCLKTPAPAKSATPSTNFPKISGVATRRDRHHHRFAQEFLALLTPSGPRPVRMKACCDCAVGPLASTNKSLALTNKSLTGS